MKTSNACPNESTLQELVSNRLAPDIAAAVTEHISGCPSCQQRLAGSESGSDLARRLPALKNQSRESSQLDEAIKRAKSLYKSPSEIAEVGTTADVGQDQADLTAFTQDGYELLGLIGRGGMGVVYKAREASLDRVVAVKVISPLLAGDPPSRERFLREARAAAKVVHPNVITIHAVSEKPPVPYLVMEFVEGVSLRQQLDSGAGISIDNVVRIGRQISAGLSAAHSNGIVHRDIKPGNILLNAQTGKVLLGDFGLARAGDHSRLTRSGTLVGTPAYVAPEVLEDPEIADHRADLFSLGVVLYAMCVGDSPFQSDSLLGTLHRLSSCQPKPLADAAPEVPTWLSEIVMRLLEKNPQNRFQSASEVRDALGHRPSGRDTVAIPNGAATQPAIPDPSPLGSVKVDTTSHPRNRQSTRRGRRQKPNFLLPVTAATAFGLLLAVIGFLFIRSNGLGGAVTQRDDGPLDDQPSATGKPLQSGALKSPAVDADAEMFSTSRNLFVCTTVGGQEAVSFASLSEAIEHSHDGGKIEIRTNGMVEIAPCFVEAAATTITAGEGYRPTLVFAPDEDDELHAMFLVEGNLTLRGLEIHLPDGLDGEDEVALIGVEPTAELNLVDCTLVVEGGGFCLRSQAAITMENCQLHSPESIALALETHAQAKTVLRNCWVSSETCFEISGLENHSITIRDCTFACAEFLNAYSDDEESLGLLSIDAKRSIFLCGDSLIILEDDPESFDRQIKWVGSNNVFSGKLIPDSEVDLPSHQQNRSEFDLLRQKVQESDSSYVANPFKVELERLPDLMDRANFRLSTLPKIETISVGAKENR